jgi:hypothetical protein
MSATCARRIAAVLGPKAAGPSADSPKAEPEPDPSVDSDDSDHEPDTHEPHMKFLEHMLLDEYVSGARGNSVSAAIEGFQQFWPGKMNVRVVPRVFAETSTEVDSYGAGKVLAEKLRSLADSTSDPRRTWDATLGPISAELSFPYLIVVGPDGTSAHGVGFLVFVEHSEVVVRYANTGYGATRCGNDAIVVVQTWHGGSVLKYIEFARTTHLSVAAFEQFVEFLKELPGYVDSCPLARSRGGPRHLWLATAAGEGTVVASPQRGGSCSYGCVLWLLRELDPARGEFTETEMKRLGLAYLATASFSYRALESRDCVRLMEAAAHAYAGLEPFKREVESLRAAVRAAELREHAAMLADRTASTYSKVIYKGHYVPEITFPVGPEPFATIAEAGEWCRLVSIWLRYAFGRLTRFVDSESGVRACELAVYYLFLEKARAVLVGRELGDEECSAETIVHFATFLGRLETPPESARGMLFRVARLAIRNVRSEARSAESEPEFELRAPDPPESPFPWVVAEHRALARESRGIEHLLFDDRTVHEDATTHGEMPSRVYVCEWLEFQQGNLEGFMWRAFIERMATKERQALNVAVLFACGFSSRAKKIRLVHEKYFDQVADDDSGSRVGSLEKRRERDPHFHETRETRVYLRLSTEDRAALHGREAPDDDTKHVQMAIGMEEGEQIAQGALRDLEAWAESEHAAWRSPEFRRMARARTLVYCAGKYLEPACRTRGSIENLDALIHEGATGGLAGLAALRRGDVGTLCARLLDSDDLNDTERLEVIYAARRGLVAAMLREIGASVDNTDSYPSEELLPFRLTTENGVRPAKWGISVRQPGRALVFECAGGVRGSVAQALRLARVEHAHWKYARHYEIEACGAKITFRDKCTVKTGALEYVLETMPSEWSSLWYTTPHAACFPVRRNGQLFLAAFVCATPKPLQVGIWFGDAEQPEPAETMRGTHFVVPFDAAGVMPACSALEAHTLLCA